VPSYEPEAINALGNFLGSAVHVRRWQCTRMCTIDPNYQLPEV
jgi:hypothetical protein